MRKIFTTFLSVVICQLATAQLKLEVTVHCEEAGTLFVMVQEQIEELGELSDIAKLTVTGKVNQDDFNVIRNQMTSLTDLDISGVDGECGEFVYMEGHQKIRHCVLPTEATSLPYSVFNGCSNLESAVLPRELKKIEVAFFGNCTKLTSIVIPETVTMIDYSAFQNTGLTSVTIPASVTEIGWGAFQDCTSLTTINIQSDSLLLTDNVFRNTGIETFTLPKGVTINGECAFADCQNLKSFYFPDGLTTQEQIGTSTLAHCSALEEVRLPQDLTILPEYFFIGTRIKSIDLPQTVTTIGESAYAGIKTMPKAVIPNHVTSIGQRVFSENRLEEVVWSENCHIIPEAAFAGCTQLTKVTIPETVDSIGASAFDGCIALEHIHLPEGIRTLVGTFGQCISLKEVNIPSTVTVIEMGGNGCFEGCAFTHIDIPDGVQIIGYKSFHGVPLEEIKLPSKLKKLGGYVFNGGTYRRITVPEGVIHVGSHALCGDSLKVIDLPSTLLTLGNNLPGDNIADQLDSIIIRTMIPPFIDGELLGWSDREATLYVPRAGLSHYKESDLYNIAKDILPLDDVHGTTLNVLDKLVITPKSGLQEDKYDVNILDSYWQGDLYGISNENHPYFRIEEGARFSMGKLNMTFITSDQFSEYTWQSFINRGIATADVIDLNWTMGAEHFFTPAFDTRLSEITPDYPNTPYAFFRYDSGARAAGNFAATWVRVGNDEILHAGQGYAFKGRESSIRDANGTVTKKWTGLHHIWNAGQGGTNYFLANDDITLPLSHFNGEFAHNRNWNFIGNPYPAFLDIRAVDYDGPMYIYNSGSWNHTWNAVSALDDEYVIDPMAAIFVQAADDVNSITFHADRRQHVKTFLSYGNQEGQQAQRRARKNQNRTVYNIRLASKENTENAETTVPPVPSKSLASTRLVINPTAATTYEIGRDLPVMNLSENPEAQLYTYVGGITYAINERPLADGIVPLGLQLTQEGTYTITLSLKQCAEEFCSADVYLIDNDEHTRTLLTDGEAYTFTATAGASTSRFVLAFGNADSNAIGSVVASQPKTQLPVYNLQGIPVSTPAKGIYIRDGKKFIK